MTSAVGRYYHDDPKCFFCMRAQAVNDKRFNIEFQREINVRCRTKFSLRFDESRAKYLVESTWYQKHPQKPHCVSALEISTRVELPSTVVPCI